MRNLRRLTTLICLIAVLTLSTPVVTLAADVGPQGGSNSTKNPPPPPPPDSGILGKLVAALMNLVS